MNELITLNLIKDEITGMQITSLTVIGGKKPQVKLSSRMVAIKGKPTNSEGCSDTYDIQSTTFKLIENLIKNNLNDIKKLKRSCYDDTSTRFINYRIDYKGKIYLGSNYPIFFNKEEDTIDHLPSMLYASINDILQRNEAIEVFPLGYYNYQKQIAEADFNEAFKYFYGRYMTSKEDKDGYIHTTCPICRSKDKTFEFDTVNNTYKCSRCGSYGNIRSFIRDCHHIDSYKTSYVNRDIDRFLPLKAVRPIPTKEEFDELILKSINTSSHLIKGTHYFDEEYAHALGKYLGYEGEKLMNEFVDLGQGRTKICSVASSARLGALYFAKREFSYPKPAGEFEKCLPIKRVMGIPPHMDYYSVDTNTHFECKCHEILDDHSCNKLKIKYKKILEPMFWNPKFVTYDKDYIYPTLRSLGMIRTDLLDKLHLKLDDSIYCLHFNVKQLLTHLMGLLSNENSVTDKLQYVFFTPSIDFMHGPESYKVRALYDILKAEIELIMDSYPVRYALKHGVVVLQPIFVDVSTIYDHALALTLDEDNCHNQPEFEKLFHKYVELGYVPSTSDIIHNDKVDPNFAFRLQYNLLLYRSKEYKFRLAFPIVNKPEDIITSNRVHKHTDIVQQSFSDYYQVCDPIAKEVYEKFLELRENKEAYETKGIK